jgi:PAS domain S-box-containing protein
MCDCLLECFPPFLRDFHASPIGSGDKRVAFELMHGLFAKQLAEATTASGEVDLARLGELVVSTYEQMDRDRRGADSVVSAMQDEVEQRLRERERIEEWLHKQTVQLDAALNNMAHALCMFDAEGQIVLFNQRYADRMELPAGMLMGMSLLDLFRHRQKTGRFTGDPEEFFARLLAGARDGRTMTRTMVDSTGRALRVIDRPLPSGGWVATFEDITEERRLEQERDRERMFLNAVIDSVPVAILVRSASDRRYVLANGAAEKYYGVSRESLIGKTVADVLPKQSAEWVMSQDEKALESGQTLVDEHSLQLVGMETRIVTSVWSSTCCSRT